MKVHAEFEKGQKNIDKKQIHLSLEDIPGLRCFHNVLTYPEVFYPIHLAVYMYLVNLFYIYTGGTFIFYTGAKTANFEFFCNVNMNLDVTEALSNDTNKPTYWLYENILLF